MLDGLRKRKTDRLPATLKQRIDAALTMTPDIYKTMTAYPFDAKGMVERRRAVNELIVALQKL
jgi:hypothetical protein